MRLTTYLTLSLALSLALAGCAGSDGTDGAQGPPGEQGPQGPPGEVDMDVLVQQLTADADFRRALAQTLINNYPEEIRGPQGEVGACDCEGGTTTEMSVPMCINPCETAADCDSGVPWADADNFECDDGLCIYLGCNSNAECMERGEDYRCLTP